MPVVVFKKRKMIPLGHVDVSLLADEVGESSADTTDGGEGVHDLLATIDVGVQHTKDVLEVGFNDQGHCSAKLLLNEK